MARHTANVWIAYADLLFVLFLVVLLAGASFQDAAESAETEAKVQKKKIDLLAGQVRLARQEAAEKARQAEAQRMANEQLRIELARRVQCADARPLLDNLSACIARAASVDQPLRADRCSLTLREDLLRFETTRAVPIELARARAIAACVYSSAREFRTEHPESFRSIATISFEGHTDCEGTASRNMRLGSERSLTLYGLLLQAAPVSEQRDRDGVLSKIAVRSYGLHKPVDAERPCLDRPWQPDRRVTISVEMRPEMRQVMP